VSHAVAAMFLLTVFWTTTVCAQAGPEAGESLNFRSLLFDSGISEQQLETFDDWDGNITDEQASTLSKILFRLSQLEQGEIHADAKPFNGSSKIGDLVELNGTVVAARSQALPSEVPGDLAKTSLKLCEVELAGGQRLTALSSRVPKDWARRANGALLEAPIRVRGVVLQSATAEKESRPLIVAHRIEWYPTAHVPSGIAWLSAHGVDAALFDDIRQNQPFAKPNESLESAAFYATLTTLAADGGDEVARLAAEAIRDAAEFWEETASEATQRLSEISPKLATASPQQRKLLEREATNLRRQQTIAARVQAKAELGLSSVWPIYLDPEWSMGRFFLIEGVARRAVRVVVDEPSSAEAVRRLSRSGGDAPKLREYYELDVFTSDSQNQPVVWCVARLPKGFPTGDAIREPVRVAGVFFKRWAYARRTSGDLADKKRLPERLAPPLLLAAETQWLPTAAPSRADRRGLWLGLAFAAALAMLWIVLARVARRDRLARRRQMRYDASLDPIAEP